MIAQSSWQSTVRWLRRTLVFTGLALLGYCAFVMVDRWQFQGRESLALDQAIQRSRNSNPQPAGPLPLQEQSGHAGAGKTGVARQRPPNAGHSTASQNLIGRIEIPRLGLSAMVVEGADSGVLRRAVGHLPSTPLPGESGNAVVTAHRDSFFRPLKDIRKDDAIRFTTPSGKYFYRVVSMTVVEPSDLSVVNRTADETLTLITCFPFSFVGHAPRRFIVRAERMQTPPAHGAT